ncbi:P-loop containing nucleoside triphosphate hydrolase protein [Cladochytrium replicatum]|nr:P-loop containing nucleoside triphosphate hydrolase protein [Cladochytrium replicatum]
MPVVSAQQLIALQKTTQNIRNICILAHVDHGKTTLSDGLLSSNGIISAKLSGKVRYLDSRDDEQERGITMKSSGISLYFKVIRNTLDQNAAVSTTSDEYLINLIDSPGHVDFSGEVSTASRLCDGALVLVDAVEGVCTQTHTVLRQAWLDTVKPILVLNKIDRLVTELKLTPMEAYVHLNKILEQVNAIMGTFFSENVIEMDTKKRELQDAADESQADWHLEIEDDSHIYFSPELGNVIFASAYDGWAFRTSQFAALYSTKLGMKESMLRKVLWGDYYLDTKAKRVIGHKALKGRALKPVFVQFVLDNIWAVYEAALAPTPDREKLEKIIKVLNLKVLPRDMKSKDGRLLAQQLLSQWLPLSSSVLLGVVEELPSPLTAQSQRLPKIVHPDTSTSTPSSSANPERAALESALYTCSTTSDAPTVAYVSKMFSVPVKYLTTVSTQKRTQLTAEELRERRKEVLRMQQMQQAADGEQPTPTPTPVVAPANDASTETRAVVDENVERMIGFARIYSGVLKKGQKIHVLGPKYDPENPDAHRSEILVDSLYLMMGRELHEIEEVPAGNIFGIAGLETTILKTGTLSTTTVCPSFGGIVMATAPIVRVALQPADLSQMPQLIEGLRLLNQADPSVEVMRQETGEHVIMTAGELHLERCLRDLRERFAKIDIHPSAPLVPYRETISSAPSLQIKPESQSDPEKDKDPTLPTGTALLSTPHKLCTLRVRAAKLPEVLTAFLVEHAPEIKAITDEVGVSSDVEGRENRAKSAEELTGRIRAILESEEGTDREVIPSIVDSIWSFGPKRTGANLLVNRIPGFSHRPWHSTQAKKQTSTQKGAESATDEELGDQPDSVSVNESKREFNIKDYESAIVTGFQLASQAGPLCAEPMQGLCFFVESVTFEYAFEESDALGRKLLGLLPGNIISTMREVCKAAFLTWSPRLMLAMYSCDLQAPAEVLGKVYAVLAKRKGRILSEELKDGTPFFFIKALLPVVESFGFAEELRKRTSGAASPQLIFHGYEVLDQDPFWVPATEEELEDLGEKADRDNVAKKYMDVVRKRKGLHVEQKIVEHAEKQKTLKNK